MYYARIARAITIAAIKKSIEFRFGKLVTIFAGPLFMYLNYSIWKAIYTTRSELGGFTLDEIVLYATMSSAVWYLISDDVIDNMTAAVQEGTLTAQLLKPFSFPFFQFFNKVGENIVAFFVEFLPVMFMAGFIVGFDLLASGNFLAYALSILIAFAMIFLIKMLLGMLAFWLIRPGGIIFLYNMFGMFLYGGFLPLSVYPAVIQKVYFFLPFQFVAYVPARLFSQEYELAGITLSTPAILGYGVFQLLIMSLLVWFLWRKSIKKYSGVGA